MRRWLRLWRRRWLLLRLTAQGRAKSVGGSIRGGGGGYLGNAVAR